MKVFALAAVLLIATLSGCTKRQTIVMARQDIKTIAVLAVTNQWGESRVTYRVYAEEVGEKSNIYSGLSLGQAQSTLTMLCGKGYPYVPFVPIYKGQKFHKNYPNFICAEPLMKFRQFTIMRRKPILEKDVDTYILKYKFYSGEYKVLFAGESGELAARTFSQRVTAHLDSSAAFKSHLMLIDARGFESSSHKAEIQTVLDSHDFTEGYLRLRFFEEDFAKGQNTPIYLITYAAHPDSMMEFAKKFYTYGEFLGCLKGL